LACVGIIYAATTIGNNISTGGTITSNGANIFYGATSIGGAITATSTLNVSGQSIFSSNVGIGTTSPYAKLSVVGETVASYFTATSTTAVSTFAGPLNVSGVASFNAASGSELVQNGNFPGTSCPTGWTCTGWTIGSNSATHNSGNTNVLIQPITLPTGHVYKFTFTISGAGFSGNVTAKVNGFKAEQMAINNTYTFYFIPSASDSLSFEPSSDFSRSISSVSIVQVSSALLASGAGISNNGHMELTSLNIGSATPYSPLSLVNNTSDFLTPHWTPNSDGALGYRTYTGNLLSDNVISSPDVVAGTVVSNNFLTKVELPANPIDAKIYNTRGWNLIPPTNNISLTGADFYGGEFLVDQDDDATNVGNLIGLSGEAFMMGGTANNLFGNKSLVQLGRSGSSLANATNLYGSYISMSIVGTGTAGSTYGVYVADITGTTVTHTNTPVSFYASDPNAIGLYSAGKVGIGTTTPSSLFTVDVGASATTTVEFGDQYSTNSKTCFNVKTTTGANASFYFNNSGIVFETHRCN